MRSTTLRLLAACTRTRAKRDTHQSSAAAEAAAKALRGILHWLGGRRTWSESAGGLTALGVAKKERMSIPGPPLSARLRALLPRSGRARRPKHKSGAEQGGGQTLLGDKTGGARRCVG